MSQRLRVWGGMLMPFLGWQAAIYMVNLASGLLLIRLLPPVEFAVFTVGFASFTLVNIIANGSVVSAMTSLGAQVLDDPREMRGLINVIYRWRIRLTALGAIPALPILVYSMDRLGYPAVVICTAGILGLVYAACQIVHQPWSVVLRLQGEHGRLQRLELSNAAVRLMAIAGLLSLWASGLVALAITAASEALRVSQVRMAGGPYVAAKPGAQDFAPRVRIVVRQAVPGVVFYAVQGQVTLGLMVLLGTQFAVASIGALNRVGALYALLAPFVDNVVAPRYARLEDARLSLIYRKLLYSAVVAAALLTAGIVMLTDVILSLLGPAYRGLSAELWIVAATSGLAFVGMTVGSLNKARSWATRSWLVIPTTLLTQVVALIMLPVETLRGALLFGLVSVLPGLLVGIYQAFLGVRAAKTESFGKKTESFGKRTVTNDSRILESV